MSVPFVRDVIIGPGTRPLTKAWRPDAATCSNRDACTPLTVLQTVMKVTAPSDQVLGHLEGVFFVISNQSRDK